MAINLNKNRDALSRAWKDVLNDKTDTNWALFGYEGQTNDLKVVSTGTQGIEELTEDLNSGKIMYAFVKLYDPKTSLPKCVLINWQGEGANTVRKGICANHLRDVEKFFTGAHLTINARNEEEVDSQMIIDKVSKAGSAYSFKAPRGDTSGPTKPVGSNYQRVNPVKEINAKERDQFWLKEEQEEKKRLEEEHKRREVERLRMEEEAKQRELQGEVERDSKTTIRNNSIDQIKQAEQFAYDTQKANEVTDYVENNEVKVNQSDVLRKQRNQEAQNLIAQRTIDARSIFEQNTSAGQMKRTPEKPVRNSILKAQAQYQFNNENQSQCIKTDNKVAEEQSDEENDQFSTIKRSPKDVDKKSVTSPTDEAQHFNSEICNENVIKMENGANHEQVVVKEEVVQQITDQQFVDEVLYGDFSTPGLQARALYDYQAADDTEITFDPGDIITNIDQVDEGWWQGLGPDGTYGLFPANYVELIP